MAADFARVMSDVTVTYDVVLRPGTDNEMSVRALPNMDAMDEWLLTPRTANGPLPVHESQRSDGHPSASGEGRIDDDGDAAYKLA